MLYKIYNNNARTVTAARDGLGTRFEIPRPPVVIYEVFIIFLYFPFTVIVRGGKNIISRRVHDHHAATETAAAAAQ